jgi:hypothetical protein
MWSRVIAACTERDELTEMKNSGFWDVIPRDPIRTDVSEERVPFIIRVERIGELGMIITVYSD